MPGGRSGDPGNEIEERSFSRAAAAPQNGTASRRQREVFEVEHLEAKAATKRKRFLHVAQDDCRLRAHGYLRGMATVRLSGPPPAGDCELQYGDGIDRHSDSAF